LGHYREKIFKKYREQDQNKALYEFGRIEIESHLTIQFMFMIWNGRCDILRGSGSDIQIVGEAMKPIRHPRTKTFTN